MTDADARAWLARTALGAAAAGVVGYLAYGFFAGVFGTGTTTTVFSIGAALGAVGLVEYLRPRL